MRSSRLLSRISFWRRSAIPVESDCTDDYGGPDRHQLLVEVRAGLVSIEHTEADMCGEARELREKLSLLTGIAGRTAHAGLQPEADAIYHHELFLNDQLDELEERLQLVRDMKRRLQIAEERLSSTLGSVQHGPREPHALIRTPLHERNESEDTVTVSKRRSAFTRPM